MSPFPWGLLGVWLLICAAAAVILAATQAYIADASHVDWGGPLRFYLMFGCSVLLAAGGYR